MRRFWYALMAGAMVAAGTLGVTTVVRRERPPTTPATLADVPLLFVKNEGRWDPRAAWVASGKEASAFFVDGGVRWALTEGWAIDQVLLGARLAPPTASAPALATVSYFEGSSRHAGLPTSTELRLDDAWPGVDAVWSGAGGHVETTYRVAPGADPARVRVAWRGADRVAVTQGGRLAVSTPVRTFEEDVPVAWQEVGGRRVAVEVSYDVAADGSYGFHVGAYDRGRELVIDPITLVYASFFGGTGLESAHGIAVDAAGNAYIAGATRSTSATFPETPGAFQTELHTQFGDAFVAKVSPDGSTLVYATYLGGGALTFGVDVDVDSAGNAYITGHAWDGFPVTAGAFQTSHAGGNEDTFVTKLNPAGTALVYSTYIGGNGSDSGQEIKVDAGGNALVYTNGTSTNFPTTPGAFQTSAGGDGDAMVSKLNSTGSALLASTYFGGVSAEITGGLAIDGGGNIIISGTTRSTSATFPETPGAFQTEFGGGMFDAFVAKLNPTLTGLLYSTYLGGPLDDLGEGVVVDAAGNAYLTGQASFGFPTTPGSYAPNSIGQFDVFVTKLNPTGTGLVYSTYIGSQYNSDRGRGIALDADGGVWLTGVTQFFSDFPTTADALQTAPGGPPGLQDAYITKLNATGTGLVYSTFLGGTGEDAGWEIALNGEGDAYVLGVTFSPASEFPVTAGAFQTQNNGGGDAFVLKLARVRPTVTTHASPGAPLGGLVRDVATVTGGTNPTGTVTFRLFSDAACQTQVFSSTVPLAAGATATSGWHVPTALGTYYWTADYSGDGGHKPATSPCGSANESVAITAFVPPPCTQTLSGDVPGPVTVSSGQSLCITNARVARAVTVSPGGLLTIANSKLAGGLSADAPAFFSLCGSDLSLPPTPSVVLRVVNAVNPPRIGDPAGGCAGNRIAGHVQIVDNLAAVTFRSNIVSHNLTITGNGPGTALVAGNTVIGTLACTGNDPAPANGGQANTAAFKTGQCVNV